MDAHLLGIYEGNGHLSIRNYYEYCQRELPHYLPDWELCASQPGSRAGEVDRPSGKGRALFENYLRWPLKLLSLRSRLFHIVDQNLAWYRYFLRGGRTVVTVHDLINAMVLQNRLLLPGTQQLRSSKTKVCLDQLARADALVCVSRNTADCARRILPVTASRIRVVHNVVPREFFPETEEAAKSVRASVFGDAEGALLHVGTPSPYKNRAAVLHILALARMKVRNTRLVMTGSPLTEEERLLVEKFDLQGHITIVLAKGRAELRKLYAAADVLVFPSLYEGFGWPPIEAMACGCPVISSDRGSLKEIVEDGGIVIPDPLDYPAFADAVVMLLRDRASRAELTLRGFKNVRRFAPEVVFPQLADVYTQLA